MSESSPAGESEAVVLGDLPVVPVGEARDCGPMVRFEVATAEPDVVMEEVCQRVMMGESLREIGVGMGFPVLRFCAWVTGEDGRRERYEAARRVYADTLGLQTVGIADGSEDARLRVDTRLKVAGRLDPERWGEGKRGGGGQTVKVVVVNPVGEPQVGVSVEQE